MADEDRSADAELVEGPAQQGRVGVDVTALHRQHSGPAVAGDVDGHHLEPHRDQPAQGRRIEHAVGGEAVDDDQRYPPPGDGQAHLMTVGEAHGVLGQADTGDLGLA